MGIDGSKYGWEKEKKKYRMRIYRKDSKANE